MLDNAVCSVAVRCAVCGGGLVVAEEFGEERGEGERGKQAEGILRET